VTLPFKTHHLLLCGSLAACGTGTSAGDPPDGSSSSGQDGGGVLVLSSSVLPPPLPPFPDEHTCAGADQSPPLSWSGGPAAESYAVVMRDNGGQIHWLIWDIPGDQRSLPASLPRQAVLAAPADAKQGLSYDGVTHGYLGPCPGGEQRQYRFVIYALDVATLPNVATSSPAGVIREAILLRQLASTGLGGVSDASPAQ
jgi:Raf kinase inhibitor-like YbhB/YbcL family protein